MLMNASVPPSVSLRARCRAADCVQTRIPDPLAPHVYFSVAAPPNCSSVLE